MGKKLGFPTANLDLSKENVDIDPAVYACEATLKNKKYKGSFTIMKSPWKVEVHLIDYGGDDFYGETLEVEVGEKINEMYEFETREELVEKIGKDIEEISNSPNF